MARSALSTGWKPVDRLCGCADMPIPTDTFWNIKKLNRVFAVSSILLVLVTLWSVMQDYDKTWRRPQQHGRVWDAALTGEKINRAMSPTEKEKLDDMRSWSVISMTR